jgi:serine/threonine protein kinase
MVYEASHRNGIRAAVKILHPELAGNPDRVARFLRDAAIASHLEHVGVVAALDDDRTEDGLCYVVFELLEAAPSTRSPRRPAGVASSVIAIGLAGVVGLAALAGLAWLAR